VNGNPDVDSIFRFTKSMQYKRLNLFFDQSAPSLQLPVYKMSPFNSQNTLFCYEAFWSLYLPFTVSIRITDIWRSYWTQRLMWLTNQTVSFHGPSSHRIENSHSYLKNLNEENTMYAQTKQLVKFLFRWKCKFSKFYDCVIDLSAQMAKKGFWGIEEVNGIHQWLNDLNSIGYIEPKIVNSEVINNFKIGHYDYTVVRYTPNFQISIDEDSYCCNGTSNQRTERLDSLNYFKNLCSSLNYSLTYDAINLSSDPVNEAKNKFNFSLLITFNHQPLEQNIVLLDHLYRHHFQNIIFCGVNITQLLAKDRGLRKKFDAYTFIELDTQIGIFHYFIYLFIYSYFNCIRSKTKT
jgi:hypothetical protein